MHTGQAAEGMAKGLPKPGSSAALKGNTYKKSKPKYPPGVYIHLKKDKPRPKP